LLAEIVPVYKPLSLAALLSLVLITYGNAAPPTAGKAAPAQQMHEDGFGLIILRVAGGNRRCAHPQANVVEEGPAQVVGDRLQRAALCIRPRRHVSAAEAARQPPAIRQLGHKASIRFRVDPTQTVLEVGDVQGKALLGREDTQQIEQADGICAAGDGNDVSERQWQRNDLQWFRAKGSDTFSPLGPWIVTDIKDPTKLELTTRLNGEVRQQTTIEMMIHDIPRVISYASEYMTLEPGDLIYSGTPGQTQPMQPGDTVEVEISEIGVLRNPVVGE